MRGLRERTKELKQKAATTFGNICALVDDTRDLLPFIPVLLPELEKAEEHSHPDLREAAARAKASLMKGIDSTQNDERKVASDIVQRAIEEAGVRVDGETQAYAAALGGWVMDSAPMRIPPSILSNDIKRELTPILESALANELESIETIANASVMAYKGLDESALLDESTKDYIVDLQGIILAFAGRVLLQRTNFTLERGRTYGIVGQNGTGKTTFIRLIAGLIQPDDENVELPEFNVSYKPQKIAPKFPGTVRELLHKKIREAYMHPQFVSDVMKPMNIDPLMDQAVQNLSGGELQRVALAMCMGTPADIYLIDEPSAYLDSEQRVWASKVIKRFILHAKKVAFIVEHDFIMATYLADRVVVYHGDPGMEATASCPQSLLTGMNQFLESLQVTFRRDPVNYRPR